MKTAHLSAWEQEEYLMGQQTAAMAQHVAVCRLCEGELARLEQGVALFRETAMKWSAETLPARPDLPAVAVPRRPGIPVLRWAFAAVLLALLLLPLHFWKGKESTPVPAINDDALLRQVDEQVSAAVPSSMESLTYLVFSGESNNNHGQPAAASPGRHSVARVE